MCKGTSVKGYPCEGSGEEVRTCKEKRCPAPHEMCRDDYIMAMTWKRTAAGGLVYNKCPPNATGSASRKCLLNSRGIAVWGPPSFARCVSHDYRHLHLSVGMQTHPTLAIRFILILFAAKLSDLTDEEKGIMVAEKVKNLAGKGNEKILCDMALPNLVDSTAHRPFITLTSVL
ncbi:hypothetical protein scyTo_0003320 [Scyliorhinus torazame]|uniref:G-protein coupled receptors family 2 profile 1 domain-containing protein n=1 Tax=Scyliorhinus torazame TaxID=75743 RepID=A0A401PM60_SCYTO|nr:hypothetical protein [Scyliorhinus torazame]